MPPRLFEDLVISETQVVVIGGGVVGCSILYHLTKAGWTDVVLLERKELTAGSTWHAAGGMHTLNHDPDVAKLQQYTVELYKDIEKISGQDCGIHLTGGLLLADTEERMDWLRMAHARGRYLGMDTELISETLEALSDADTARKRALADFERSYVDTLLRRHRGKMTAAATDAGIGRAYMWKLAAKHGLEW